ncbi:MAG: hypothetical protein IPL72_03235 [Sulfuritalea sp.]|nr:hypothetical protein [Sulfuritalea sp.]
MTHWLLAMIAGGAFVLPALAQDKAAQAPRERTIYVAAVESKGGVHVDHEPFPTDPIPEGGGYLLKKPDDKGRWEVSSYRWDPGTIVVNQGDKVTPEIVGINGNEHPVHHRGLLADRHGAARPDHPAHLYRRQGRHLQDHRPHAFAVHAGGLVVLANK